MPSCKVRIINSVPSNSNLNVLPFFSGQGELDQIDLIFSLVGLPNADSWPGFEELPNSGLFRWKPKPNGIELPKKFPVGAPLSARHAFLDGNGYDLLRKMLLLDPTKRISAKEALDHDFFSQGVAPQVPKFFAGGV